jgi:hypothetical protein
MPDGPCLRLADRDGPKVSDFIMLRMHWYYYSIVKK